MIIRINIILVLAIILVCELLHAAASIKILRLDEGATLCKTTSGGTN